MNVAVVILNWNGRNHLETYLPSVVQNSGSARIILADNASTDDSVDFVQNTYPQVEIIRNPENGGFALGYNQALSQVEADIYVLLNSDVEVTPNWIEPVVNRMKSDENIAACQPTVLSYLNKDHFEHAGAAGGFIDRDGFPFCRGRMFHEAELNSNQYNSSSEIFWATGACLFIRSKYFHEAGGFDADFFAHMEEIDLCWRLKRKGLSIWHEAGSQVYHLGGGTLQYMSPRKTYLNFRNNLFMLHKNYPGVLFPKVFKRMVLDGVAATKFLVGFQFSHLWAVTKSHFHYYGRMASLNKKRKAIKNDATVSNVSAIYQKSIVLDFFLRKKRKFSDLDPNDFSK